MNGLWKKIDLQYITELGCNIPIPLTQLVLPQFHIPIPRYRIKCFTILNRKVEHIKSGVPSCPDITRHHALVEVQILENEKPFWKDEGSGVLDCEGRFAKLAYASSECHGIWMIDYSP